MVVKMAANGQFEKSYAYDVKITFHETSSFLWGYTHVVIQYYVFIKSIKSIFKLCRGNILYTRYIPIH